MSRTKEMPDALDVRGLAQLGTLRQLEIFLKVAEVGGIAQAAQQLHLSQPSVSIQVRKLTEAVGLPLYEVIGRQLSLTEAGRRVQAAGRELVELLDRLDSSLGDLKGVTAGRLRLAVDSSAKYFLPQLLGPFLQRYPGIELNFVEGKRSELLERIKGNRDDLYIFNRVPKHLDITHHPFLPNPLVVVARKDNPLALRKRLSWEDLSGERIILRDVGSGSRLALDEHLVSSGLVVERPLVMASSEAIKLSVMSNIGVGILSAYALVYADADGLVQLPVSGFPVTTQWHVIHLRQKQLSPVAESFLQFMLEEGRDHLPMKRIEARLRQAQGN